jgi:MFS family permease
MASSMITIIATTVIAASLPYMAEAYASASDSRFLVNIALTLPALSVALFGPVAGMVIDRWGRKRLFVAAMILYGVSGTAGSYLPSLSAILISRFILGISVAAITTCATALIADYASERKLGSLMGRQSLFKALGNVVFVSLGGVLAGHHWRLPFLLYAVSLLILPGVVFSISEPPSTHRSPSPTGSPTPPPTSADTIPIARTFFVYSLGFINMVVYFMVPVYLPFHLRSFPNNSSAKLGGLLSLVGLSWGISSSLYHRVRRSLSFEQIMIVALGCMGVSDLLLGLASGYSLVIPALVIAGIGLGAIVPNLNAWLLSFTPPARKGRALGGLAFFVFLGQFASPIFTRPLSNSLGFARSYLAGGALLLVVSVGCAIFALRRASIRLSRADQMLENQSPAS